MDHDALNWSHCLEQVALSDIGLRRANNQDSQTVVLAGSLEKWRQRGHLFMVADGMGAHAAGELASKLATDTVPLTYYKLREAAPPDALREAIEDAHQKIHARGEANSGFRGMGTTASVLVLLPEGALVGHVGDSRVYRLRQNRLEQLTFDHSLVWEVRKAEKLSEKQIPEYIPKNVITRSLGPNPTVKVDLEGPFPVAVGDVFLLCSDGLSGKVTDEELGKLLGCIPPEEAAQTLVDLANLRGGPDNITVVIARVTGPELTREGAEALPSPPADSRWAGTLYWILLAVLIAIALSLGMIALKSGGLVLGLVAAACAIGAVVCGVVASNRVDREPTSHYQFDGKMLGKGPYTACECRPDAPFVEQLSDIIQQLRQLADREEWNVDWDRFNKLTDRAAAAFEAGDHASATQNYSRAVRFVMAAVKGKG